jgi:hypothetical protein
VGGLRIALKKLYREWRALGITEQPNDHLALPPLPSAIVAKGRQCLLVAFDLAAGDSIDKEARGLGRRQRLCQAILDDGWVVSEPIEIVIQIVFRKGLQTEDIADGMGTGEAHSGEPNAWVKEPRHDLPQR